MCMVVTRHHDDGDVLVANQVLSAHMAAHAWIARRDAVKACIVLVAQGDQATIWMMVERRCKLLADTEADHADAELLARHRAPTRSMASAAAITASRPCPAAGSPRRARIASTRCRSSSVSTDSGICGRGSVLSKP